MCRVLAVLAVVVSRAFAAEILVDGSFETTPPDGREPTNFHRSTTNGDWGGCVTTTAKYQGNAGFWCYTPSSTLALTSAYYQEFPASPGQVYRGSAFVRTQTPWASGSRACVRIEFWGISGRLAVEEGLAVTTGTWVENVVVTNPAPSSTTRIRFIPYLFKPAATSATQSVCSFDVCSLTLASTTPAQPVLSPTTAGIATSGTETSLLLSNLSGSSTNWTAASSLSWLSVTPSSGVLDSAPVTLTVSAQKNGVTPGIYTTTITVTTAEAVVQSAVHVAVGPLTPSGSTVVRINGHQCLVNGQEIPWKAVVWTTNISEMTADARRASYRTGYVADFKAAVALGCNVVVAYLSFGTDQVALEVLDCAAKLGLKLVIVVDGGNNDLAQIQTVVPIYKSHPAVLAWMVGIESTITGYMGKFSSISEVIAATENAAKLIKSLDADHPVLASIGDHEMATNQQIVSGTPNVDVYSVNSYRGKSFGTLFDDWKALTTKPIFIGEYGVDSYDNVAGKEDQQKQAEWLQAQTIEIGLHLAVRGGNVLGCSPFSLREEWVKGGAGISVHGTGGFVPTWNMSATWDSYFNEAWFGLYTKDLQEKLAAAVMRAEFALWLPKGGGSTATPPTISSQSASPNPAVIGETVTFTAAAVGQEPITYTWNFGDGTNGSGSTVTHSFAAAGTYQTIVSATDVNGTASGVVTVTVAPSPISRVSCKVFYNVRSKRDFFDFTVAAPEAFNQKTFTVTVGSDAYSFVDGVFQRGRKKPLRNDPAHVFIIDGKLSIGLVKVSLPSLRPPKPARWELSTKKEMEIPIALQWEGGSASYLLQSRLTLRRGFGDINLAE